MRDLNMGQLRRLAASPLALGFGLAVAGFLIWIALSLVVGFGASAEGFRLREAWDTEAYFYVGVPVMSLVVGVAGFLNPERVWRWALWLAAGHQTGVLVLGLGMQSGLSLIILTLALGSLLAVVFALPALAGAEAARRIGERVY